jgi:hypothetical protein
MHVAVALLAIMFLAAASGPAQELPFGIENPDVNATGNQRAFMVFFENDTFADTDRYYTNAVRFTVLSRDLDEYKDYEPTEKLINLIKKAPFVNEPGLTRNIGVSLGQDIFTPSDIEREELIEDERPYAGWLYLSLALHSKNATRLDTFETSLGIVGPAALSEYSQNIVHHIKGDPLAEGWEHQLENEPGVMLTWQRSWRTHRHDGKNNWDWDAMPHLGGTVGNVMTYANMGYELRYGYDIPDDFGTALIKPGAAVGAPGGKHGSAIQKLYGAHVFLGADVRAVARNIFLDGNTFTESHSVDKIPFVFDIYSGVSVHWKSAKLTYTHVFRSWEFEGQDSPQLFGSLSLAWPF